MGRPTLTTLCVFVIVFLLRALGGPVGIDAGTFTLSLPLGVHPWSIAASVYAHATLSHLVANAIALVLVGPLVAYVTTPARFHAFFLTTGAIAGLTQVLVAMPFGGSRVLGASGAIFALVGYLLVGNRTSEWAISWLPVGHVGRAALFVGLAVGVTLVTAAPGVALVAHFTGFLLGALGGRFRLLHDSRSASTTD